MAEKVYKFRLYPNHQQVNLHIGEWADLVGNCVQDS